MHTTTTLKILLFLLGWSFTTRPLHATEPDTGLDQEQMTKVITFVSGEDHEGRKPLVSRKPSSRIENDKWHETIFEHKEMYVMTTYRAVEGRISIYWKPDNEKRDGMLSYVTVNKFGELLNGSDPECTKLCNVENTTIRPHLKEFWQGEANKLLRLIIDYQQSPH